MARTTSVKVKAIGSTVLIWIPGAQRVLSYRMFKHIRNSLGLGATTCVSAPHGHKHPRLHRNGADLFVWIAKTQTSVVAHTLFFEAKGGTNALVWTQKDTSHCLNHTRTRTWSSLNSRKVVFLCLATFVSSKTRMTRTPLFFFDLHGHEPSYLNHSYASFMVWFMWIESQTHNRLSLSKHYVIRQIAHAHFSTHNTRNDVLIADTQTVFIYVQGCAFSCLHPAYTNCNFLVAFRCSWDVCIGIVWFARGAESAFQIYVFAVVPHCQFIVNV